jgi:hypothetical protein
MRRSSAKLRRPLRSNSASGSCSAMPEPSTGYRVREKLSQCGSLAVGDGDYASVGEELGLEPGLLYRCLWNLVLQRFAVRSVEHDAAGKLRWRFSPAPGTEIG